MSTLLAGLLLALPDAGRFVEVIEPADYTERLLLGADGHNTFDASQSSAPKHWPALPVWCVGATEITASLDGAVTCRWLGLKGAQVNPPMRRPTWVDFCALTICGISAGMMLAVMAWLLIAIRRSTRAAQQR